MNCEWVKHNAVLYAYDELSDGDRFELERHLERCTACAAEVAETRGLQSALSAALPVAEPSPNLLTASRMRLQEALESTEQLRGWRRWTFDPFALLRAVKFAPALALVIFMVGFGGGTLTAYRLLQNRPANGILATADPAGQPAEASIAAIRGISVDPGSNQVEIKYDAVRSGTRQGSINDPEIQQLLLMAARNNMNSGVRMDSVDLLTRNPEQDSVRQALIYALSYDNNPGVRLKALEGLRNYVREDMQVRNAVLEALLNDENPGVRAEAIHLLEPVRADSTVRRALRQLAEYDDSNYIRSEARRVLLSLPEME